MGWKGTLRSISASMRAAERESQRRHKQAVKANISATAADAVQELEDYLESIVSIHVRDSEPIDWLKIANTPRPLVPQLTQAKQDEAVSALANFKPSLLDRLSGGTAKRIEKLQLRRDEAAAQDRQEHERAVARHQSELAEWETDTSLARRLASGETAALKEVIEEMQTLTSDTLIGTRIDFEIDENFVHAMPEVHTDEIVPRTRRKQLSSGSLSETDMPAAQFNELYQDYVSSVALRVAGDMFSLTPLPEVYVTCFSKMLNPTTGHQENMPVLSVHFVRETFLGLKLARIDPSDSLRNFRHQMVFKRSKGFSAVEPIAALRGRLATK